MPETTPRKTATRKNTVTAARPLRTWHDSHRIQEDVQVNIVPLIDVIFCILTFFILGAVGLSRQQAISLDLPKASTSTTPMREMLVVSLDDVGQLYVEKQMVTREQLFEAIKNYHQNSPNGLMVLNASRNASYNEVVGILDLLRQVGGDRVALATLPGESTSSTAGNPSLPGLENTNPWGNSSSPTLPNRSLPSLPNVPDSGPRSSGAPRGVN
ncbi:ExbD/TolR family protein [Pannus brasiliensis]|uniref:ExbD/TolR family protein n=1 Tax=Pannus brasiliensis TaxID=1579216 RepID=UPI003BEF2AF0